MQQESQRRRAKLGPFLGWLAVLGLISSLGPHSIAQDPASPRDAPGAESPQSSAAEEKELETFVPTEKVPVGSAVAFPVDI